MDQARRREISKNRPTPANHLVLVDPKLADMRVEKVGCGELNDQISDQHQGEAERCHAQSNDPQEISQVTQLPQRSSTIEF